MISKEILGIYTKTGSSDVSEMAKELLESRAALNRACDLLAKANLYVDV
jgi:hypothetical protein